MKQVSERIVFDGPTSKLLGKKIALKLGLAVRVVEGRESVKENDSRPQGQSHPAKEQDSVSEDGGSAAGGSKTDLNAEWERFRKGEANE